MDNPKGPTVSTGTSTEHTERTYMGKDPEEEQIHVCALLNQVPVHLKQTQVQISNLLQQKIKKLPKKKTKNKKTLDRGAMLPLCGRFWWQQLQNLGRWTLKITRAWGDGYKETMCPPLGLGKTKENRAVGQEATLQRSVLLTLFFF